MAVAVSLMALVGCATTGGKPKQAAEVKPQPSAAEQLADSLNATAQAKREKGDAYRDPAVRSMHGAPQASNRQLNQSAFPAASGPSSDGPEGIGALVTQPTAVNANRSSIYAAPPPIAVNPDGTLASSQPVPQGATPIFRSMYSTPPGAVQNSPAQQTDSEAPSGQSSQAVIPPPVIRGASAASAVPMKPTADATPSKIMPARGSNARKLDSQEALMVARMVASKGQEKPGNPMLVQPKGNSGP